MFKHNRLEQHKLDGINDPTSLPDHKIDSEKKTRQEYYIVARFNNLENHKIQPLIPFVEKITQQLFKQLK